MRVEQVKAVISLSRPRLYLQIADRAKSEEERVNITHAFDQSVDCSYPDIKFLNPHFTLI